MNNNNYVAIMAGGIGSRFWPMSTSDYPKQFLDILNTGQTLLQATYERYLSFIPNENIYIVTSDAYIDIVAHQLPNLPNENILGESDRKNTAPCVAYIAFKLQQQNPNANLVIAPSDHLITDARQFMETCSLALNYTSENNAFVTLGINPSHPNTGYGYIQYEQSENEVRKVKRFTEKPTMADATTFITSGDYLWNAGIFIWKTKDIIEAFKSYSNDLYQAFNAVKGKLNTAEEKQAVDTIYASCESISIDYAIMEHAQNVYVIPSHFPWSDLGTWNSAWENFSKDENQNAIAGEYSLAINAKNCTIQTTEDKLIVVGGVEGLIIVNTEDALLVCRKEDEQEIKAFAQKAKERFPDLNI
jgi:mannose-1-phosphate guanylyltransferase